MWQTILLGLAVTAAPAVEVKTLDGKLRSGELEQVTVDVVLLKTGGDITAVPVENLMAIRFEKADPPPRIAPKALIELTDGSRILADSVGVRGDDADISLHGGGKLKASTRQIKWIRLNDPLGRQEEFRGRWQKLTADDISGDALVLRKVITRKEGGAATVTKSLDYVTGVLRDVGRDVVDFEYAGDLKNVSRKRVFQRDGATRNIEVEGLIYYHPSGRTVPDPVCLVRTRLLSTAAGSEFGAIGSTYQALNVQIDGESLLVTTASGAQVSLPMSRVSAIDYSAGKLQYLSDLQPVTVEREQSIFTPAALSKLEEQLASPTLDKNFRDRPLQIAGDTFDKGLAVRARTVLEYRIPRGFTRFQAAAGIDAEASRRGQVQLRILGDEQPLDEQTITYREEPISVDVEVASRRRLRIVVDFTDQNKGIGDLLILGNARFVK